MSRSTRQKIADQLFFRVLSFYLGILVVVVALVTMVTFDYQKRLVDEELSLLGEKSVVELATPLWFFDDEQLQNLVVQLQDKEIVSAVELRDQQQENTIAYAGDVSIKGTFSNTFNISYSHDAGEEIVGVLVLYSSATVVIDRITMPLIIMIVGMIVMLVVLWLALRVVGKQLLSTPLQQLGEHLASLEFSSIGGMTAFKWEKENNELSQLVRESNQMSVRLNESKTALVQLQQSLEKTVEERTAELKQREERFKAISENITDWIWEVDERGVYTYSNDRISDLLGYESGEVIGKTPFDFMSEEEKIRVGGIFAEIVSQKAIIKALENTHIHKEGYPVEVETNGVPIFSASGKLLGYRGSDTNISKRKQIEWEQQRLLQAKDDFFASMSHELRTPLAAIIGNTELIAERVTDPETQELISSIQAAGRGQLALVNDILDMSKIESGKFTIEELPYNLSTLLKDLEKMFDTSFQDAGVEYTVEQKNSEEYLLIGDGQRIAQVLMNLIGNALKFTEQGYVRLTSHVDREQIYFTVEDSGIGMSPETVAKLFSRFEQADGSITRRFGGSGLGLYISMNLAELMGGTIDVTSCEGEGSTFRLTLPYRVSEIKERREYARERSESVLNEQLRGNVLIAEDTPLMQQLVRRTLEKMGLTVTTANNGLEAVEFAVQQDFDLILMDMQMPEMDGIEATQILRERGLNIPIFALTANVMEKHREQFIDAGCNEFIGKPIDNRQLKRLLVKYLNQ